MSEDERRQVRRELVAFLRSRRARLSPRDVGLNNGARRRTPGLRREEVAHLAGVGVTWYTWFEQGREIQVSEHFIERVASALRLDTGEREHLFTLAQNRLPPLQPAPTPHLTPALERLVATLPNPAYLETARRDVLAWSPAFSRVFGDLARVAPERRNMLWLAFVDPNYRRMMTNWEPEARAMLASFRVELGRHADDPAFVRLVRELEATSPDFQRWWPEQRVLARGEGAKRFQHEAIGEIEFEHSTFVVAAAPELRLVVYTPLPGESTSRVQRLYRGPAQSPKASE
jgi:hypothetical protein